MALDEACPERLSDLCSEDQLKLIDAINRLRPQGIDHDVSTPQIIVCGDRSSGKSSLLRAITGLSFPVGNDICTRFPIKHAWRRDRRFNVSASVVPLHPRDESDRQVLPSREAELETLDGLGSSIKAAESIMDISATGTSFSTSTLQKEISGPRQPHFTIVDLPGLVPAQTKHLEDVDAKRIQDVVTSYMKNPRSIILAVVSAKDESVNQDVLYLAHSVDPGGNRTLGIITKPDTLDPGSKREARYASLARNQEIEFDLGWHVMMNSDSEAGETSTSASRDEQEAAFLGQGVWGQLPRSMLGAEQLRGRLCKILSDRTTLDLPKLMSDIERKRGACKEELAKLGLPRDTYNEQQFHLLQISQSFQRIAKSAIDGNWNHPFFEVRDEAPNDYQCRIRAYVQHLHRDFHNHIWEYGHRREIIDQEDDDDGDRTARGEGKKEAEKEESKEKVYEGSVNTKPLKVIRLTRDEFVKHVKRKIEDLRGCELPGPLNPLVVGELFREQSAPWEFMTRDYVKFIWKTCKRFLEVAITHVADDAETATAILQLIVEPSMKRIWKDVQDKTEHILQFHRRIQPITYNVKVMERVAKVRTARRRAALSRTLKIFFNMQRRSTVEHGTFQLNDLLGALDELYTAEETDTTNATDALDILEVYYKIVLDRFIDNIAIEVIEVCLMSALPDILSPAGVYKMDPVLLRNVAGESEDRRALRARLSEQLEILAEAAQTCKHFESIADTQSPVSDKLDAPSSDGMHTQIDDVEPPGPEYYVWDLGERCRQKKTEK
ncbi:hypothetical protein PG985_015064 [Apiospora marii]|uniref:uncharacterized protein n=1 Tax=Apiospora marii TaxID=335849 RepID=UPI00312EC512